MTLYFSQIVYLKLQAIMLEVCSVEQLVPLLFDNFEFITKLKQFFPQPQTKSKAAEKQTYNKSVLSAVEEVYQDVYQIIKFNLNQSINGEFNDLVQEVIGIKKQILNLDITLNQKIELTQQKIRKIEDEALAMQKKKQIGNIEQGIKERIDGAKSVMRRYKQSASTFTQSFIRKSDHQLRGECLSGQKIKNDEYQSIREEFLEFKKALKKSYQIKFQNIWRVIISIRQTLDELAPAWTQQFDEQFLPTDTSNPEQTKQKEKIRDAERVQ